MYRNDIKHRSYDIELLENYYSVHNANDMVNFFEMIKNGKDDMYELRRQASHKYVKHFDGKNGQRIKEFIEEKYFELDS
jgi:hypothetical protein